MPIKNLREAEEKKNYIEVTLKRLRKSSRKETDKRKKKEINKQIKKLDGSLPALRRYIYEKTKDKIQKEDKQKEELLRQLEEVERTQILKKAKENLHNRRSIMASSSNREEINNQSFLICQSCGIKIRDVYGTSRCGCS